MALQFLSVGDILMLSQTAWKIGRAFTHGRKGAPAEFAEVERESNGLSDALKLVAETLHSDGSILNQADGETKAAVNTILESARKTLADLESFVDRYQIITRKSTNGGFVVERTWADAVLANYRTFKWTTEGGDINDLRNMLQMHTSSIQLTMQALQSRSLARLEKAVVPMAERIDSIHDRIHGDLGLKIDDLHSLIMSIANSTPFAAGREGPGELSYGHNRSLRNSASTTSTLESLPSTSPRSRYLEASARDSSYLGMNPVPAGSRNVVVSPRPIYSGPTDSRTNSNAVLSSSPQRDHRQTDSGYYSAAPVTTGDRRMDWTFESGNPPVPSEMNDTYSNNTPVDSAYLGPESPPRRTSKIARRESTTLPNIPPTTQEAEFEDDMYPSSRRDAPGADSPPTPAGKSRTWRISGGASGASFLGPPAMGHDGDDATPVTATPSTFFSHSRRPKAAQHTSNFESPQFPVRPQTASKATRSPSLTGVVPSYTDGSKFEKSLFRNSAILCDVRCKLIEYAQAKPDEPDPRYNVEMIEAVQEARVCVIRRRENREHGGHKIVTSIWTLSDGCETKLQQKLSEVNETVPYCSYFEPEKVSLQPTDGPEINLKFHGEQWGDEVQKEVSTNWINYYFVSENDAVAFQSAVFGRMLIGSYRTTKTTVIHEGIKGAFAFEEQFANIEMLRLWEDDGISTPGAAGGVLALMHISSNFGEGWARWWINNSKHHVKVKEDGAKHAKVKGIDISVVRPSAGQALQRTGSATTGVVPERKVQVKRVTGVRIEFKTDTERAEFVGTAKRMQERPLPLPDL